MDVKKENKADSFLKRVDMTTILILFFLGVVMAYYTTLQSEMKQKVIVNQELIATKHVNRINEYLSSGVEVMRIASDALDGMIRDRKSPEEIREFLVNQSATIEHITKEKSTGIYAVVKDVYLDGTGWVPDADYVPKKRPWYRDAMANIGQVAVVEPYIDAKTNTMTITLAKSLTDVKSVVAMDLSLEPLQHMTEELTANGDTDIEIILDRKYRVLAHSNKAEVGKEYIAEQGTFGRALVDKMRSSNEKYFSFRFGSADYIAYTMPVADSWLCLSVFDATATFAQLRRAFLLTLFVSLVVISILLFIMNRYEKKTRLAQEYSQKAETEAAANEAKSSFLSNMSHEIRTPINAVLGMNEMILRECEDQMILGYAEHIKTAGNTLLSLINDILDFSKIEAGKIDIIPVEYDLSTLVDDLVMMAKVRADKKDLTLTLDFDQETPKLLYGDEVRIKQIITNILTNAVKYTEKGGVTFSLSFERVEGAEDKIMLAVAIKDTGIGIKPEDLSKLFSKFERIEEKRNRHIEGTGLGMSITKMLLDMMDSHLDVDSVYGEGSTFSFRIEQKVIKWEPLGDYAASYAQMLKTHKKYREKFTAPEAHVLVADDNEMNLAVFKSLLKRTKMQINTVSDGVEAVEAAMARKYDIIFLDHMMPNKDGIQALQELRQHPEGPNRETPAISLTANAIAGAKDQYIEAGFNDYMAKPIDADKLEDVLIAYLPENKVVKTTEDSTSEDKPKDVADDLPESLRPLQGESWIDLNCGIKNNGSVDDYLPILKIFYESLDGKIDEIEGFYTHEDWPNYTIKVHALKSSARIIGATGFGEEAQLLENAGKAGDIAYIHEHHEAFMAECRSFKAPLAEVFKTSAADKPEADAEMMDAILEEIRLAAENMDLDQLESIFDELADYQIPKNQEELWQQLQKAAQRYDYQEILSILAK